MRATRLHGGITAAMHQLTIEDRRGARTQVVLRRWLDGIDRAEAVGLVEREAHALRALAAHPVPAPTLIASDGSGEEAGALAVLMTRVPGRVDLQPTDPDRWLQQLAETLVEIHALPIDAAAAESWFDPANADASDAPTPSLWHRAGEVVATTPPPATRRFIHRDYQHFNVLWRRGRLSGVVDWVNAATGPPEIDVGHCRLNLAALYSAEMAERFRSIYESASGHRCDPRGDVEALLSFGPRWPRFLPVQIAGRAPFDAAGAHARVEVLLAAAMQRLGG